MTSEICKHCDHFIEENRPKVAIDQCDYIHCCDEDHHIPDDHHDAVPREGEPARSLASWKKHRPDLFKLHEDGRIGPNSRFHVTQLAVKPPWEERETPSDVRAILVDFLTSRAKEDLDDFLGKAFAGMTLKELEELAEEFPTGGEDQ